MITQEHLEHWILQMKVRLNAMKAEIDPNKVLTTTVNVGENGDAIVSFFPFCIFQPISTAHQV